MACLCVLYVTVSILETYRHSDGRSTSTEGIDISCSWTGKWKHYVLVSQPVGVQLLFHIYVFDISSTLVLCCWFFFFKLCRAEKYGPLYRLFVFHKCMLMPSSHTMVKVSGRMDPCRHVHSCYTYICLPECWRNMLLNINCWSCLKPFTVGVPDQEQVPKGQACIWQSLLPVWTEVSGECCMVWWVSPWRSVEGCMLLQTS